MLLFETDLHIVRLSGGGWIGAVGEIRAQWCDSREGEETSEEEHPKNGYFFLVSEQNNQAYKKDDGKRKENHVQGWNDIRSIQILQDTQGEGGVPIGEQAETRKHGTIGEGDNPACPLFDRSCLEEVPILGIRRGDGFSEEIL